MKEHEAWKINGFIAIIVGLVLAYIGVVCTNMGTNQGSDTAQFGGWIILAIICWIAAVLIFSGIAIIQPNNAKVITFFGRYYGSIRDAGLWMAVPLTLRQKVNLRVSNFNSKTLKVNDVMGNPVEIAAVVVFRVVDTAKALFDVSDYYQFVEIQSETALRHVATKYPYDDFESHGISLRSNPDEVATELARELQERLAVAGVEVIEARLTHLAYATEIAAAMLQRQQATAIVSARSLIVEGAVGMARMAIQKLEDEKIVELDDERKVAMINNLMVAIVSERGAQPIINTSSLY
jgi:regulator of protease activity HflC (stomatin/prohibitin superfamily)